MAITPELIHHHLTHLPQRRSLDGALELFDALGYQYADELPLLIGNWPAGIQRLLRSNAEPPIYLAQQRDFRVVYTYLTTDHLSRTVERPIVEQSLYKLNPHALFVFANRDLTLWDWAHIEVGGLLRKSQIQRRSSVALSSGAYRRVGAKRRIETKRVVCKAARLVSCGATVPRYATLLNRRLS